MSKKKSQQKAQKTSKKRAYVPRKTYRFQLRVDHPVDTEIGGFLDSCKQRRQQQTAIRDGVRLLRALDNGDVSVLLELLPNAYEMLRLHFQGETGGAVQQFIEMVSAGRMPVPVASGLQPVAPRLIPSTINQPKVVERPAGESSDDFLDAML